jgi:glycosyltransferase involved in cell wall biosynthesis
VNNPRISLMLPVYNGETWLRSCVQSVLEQTFTDFELLVGDDASADRSREIVASFSDPRIRVYPSEANIGLFANLNRLLREAKAPLVRFLCQDDALEPFAAAEEVASLEAHPGVVLSICQAREIDECGEPILEWPRSSNAPIVYSSAISLQLLLYHGCIAGNLSTMCVRRALLQELGGFDEAYRLAGDYDLLVRLCRRGPILDLQKVLVRIRRHSRRLSLSKPARKGFVDETRRIRAQLIPMLLHGVRSYAVWYTYWRQNVLDTHCMLRCLVDGRFSDCRNIAGTMGIHDVAAGLVAWTITLNNHIYSPRPRYQDSGSALSEPSLTRH